MHRNQVAVITKQTALSSEFLVEIGRITVHFAILERDLTELTHMLLGLPKNSARAITSELSFRTLQNLAASLVKEAHPKAAPAFKELLKAVSKCEEKRNQISHSLWGSGGGNLNEERKVIRTKYSAKQSNGLVLQREELTAADLHKIAAEISIAAFDLEGFHASLFRGEYADG
jgi:hypothetical protein